MAKIILKENDVYKFRFNEHELKNRQYPNHCFDGTLIVKKYSDNRFFLEDTYWSCGESKSFTLSKAIELGSLTFLCNLDEMQDIERYEVDYYNDSDIVELTIHAGDRNRILIKKGTQRSQSKMLESIKRRISDKQDTIKYAESSLKQLNETLLKIESGDTTVYL